MFSLLTSYWDHSTHQGVYITSALYLQYVTVATNHLREFVLYTYKNI
jgi:hypothetical protein